MVRLQITLDPIEADVLMSWATAELRDPREQIRFILRQELTRRGLLQPDPAPLAALPVEDIKQNEGGSNATN